MNASITPFPVKAGAKGNLVTPQTVAELQAFEQKLLWLACWMIHHANNIRPKRDGLKVGAHQSSVASANTIHTALLMDVLKPKDRVALKPHGAPTLHSLLYLMGELTQQDLESFRAFGGVQSYPSRTKDKFAVDFSGGSMGLPVAATLFASLAQDYVHLQKLVPPENEMGRLITVAGDAELDEGNIFEALLEGWKHDIRNTWWIIDYNRQSLDGVVHDYLSQRIHDFFGTVGWEVKVLKYGKLLEAAFEGPAGEALRQWIETCPNMLYSAISFQGGRSWREHLSHDLKGTSGLKELLDSHSDAALHALMTNLGGHDMETLLEAFHSVDSEAPHCFVAYTIKGHRLPFAGHKDNHAGLMTDQQIDQFRESLKIPKGQEWDPLAGLEMTDDEFDGIIERLRERTRKKEVSWAPVIAAKGIETPEGAKLSTQETFGRIMTELGRQDNEFTKRIVTTSPDVTVSTSLGGWVNRKGVFHRREEPDAFRNEQVPSPQKWEKSPSGQHIELGIAENNFFTLLAELGVSEHLFGARLLPIGTLYDIFIGRGLDALNYACYQDSRFMLILTPSGLALAPEGGAHQSNYTNLITMGQDGLEAFEPAFADEVAVMMAWGFEHMQKPEGASVCLRLVTRPIDQPQRDMNVELRENILAGAYWLREPAPGGELVIAFSGPVAPEAIEAYETVIEDVPGAGLLNITSADRLHKGWTAASKARQAGDQNASAHIERILSVIAPDASLVTVLDAHPATLDWLGATGGYHVVPLGVEKFGQCGDVPDLYHHYRIDTDAIVEAAAQASLQRLR